MHQRKRLGQPHIQAQRAGQRARNLSHLKRVCQPAAEMIAEIVVIDVIARQSRKDLRLAGQPPEGPRVQNPRRVARKGRAIGVRRLRIGSPRQLRAFIATNGNAGRQLNAGFGFDRHRISFSRSDSFARGSGLVIPQKGLAQGDLSGVGGQRNILRSTILPNFLAAPRKSATADAGRRKEFSLNVRKQ